MQLEHIDTVLRLRTPWEAIDLGFALARRWWLPVFAAWFAVLLPLALLLHLLCYQHLWLVPWLVWWLKPLLDRVPLYVLGQALFGTPPPLRQTLRALPGLLWRQALPALTWRRLSPARSFYLPVEVLEKLHGRERRERIKTLSRRSGGAGGWLTFTCLHLEFAIDFALIGLVWLLFPDFIQLELDAWLETTPQAQQLLLNLVMLLGLSLIEPFYVAAGFALYLNRRTWLEAWDLELGFRQLAVRLHRAQTVIAVLLVIGLAATALPPALAEPATNNKTPTCVRQDEQREQLAEADSPIKQALAETLAEEAFRRCETKTIWRWQDDKPDLAEPAAPVDLSVFARLVELLLWLAVAVGAVLVLRYLRQRLAALPGRTTPPPELPVADLHHNTPLAPPAPDSGQAAWQLWQQGEQRAALALLYRASIAGLSTQHALELPDHATEDDCLHQARVTPLPPPLLTFFTALTGIWQAAAYAHRLPEAATVQALCTEWAAHFTARTA